jgi:NAD-dependent dihydropyrimidine dehydrogenase PreA subunit
VTDELPALDETRCIGSAGCVAICPTNCLEFFGGRPWLPRPADCIACNLCVLICPTAALRLVPDPEDK